MPDQSDMSAVDAIREIRTIVEAFADALHVENVDTYASVLHAQIPKSGYRCLLSLRDATIYACRTAQEKATRNPAEYARRIFRNIAHGTDERANELGERTVVAKAAEQRHPPPPLPHREPGRPVQPHELEKGRAFLATMKRPAFAPTPPPPPLDPGRAIPTHEYLDDPPSAQAVFEQLSDDLRGIE